MAMDRGPGRLARRHQRVILKLGAVLLPVGGAFPEGGGNPETLDNAQALAAAMDPVHNWLLRVSLDFFDLWACVWTGESFRSMSPRAGLAYARSWETSRILAAREVYTFLRALALVSAWEQAEVRHRVGGV